MVLKIKENIHTVTRKSMFFFNIFSFFKIIYGRLVEFYSYDPEGKYISHVDMNDLFEGKVKIYMLVKFKAWIYM